MSHNFVQQATNGEIICCNCGDDKGLYCKKNVKIKKVSKKCAVVKKRFSSVFFENEFMEYRETLRFCTLETNKRANYS
jgi:hypothetical protein